ncbi:PRC-barrel domain-containing protein [Dyadobacter psychrotolerans]|uniref:PRC-barrel domain containing protein n=1 Tax=Dyadobacter psychrotolerans TaxID=2541721 RepID=A0A4V2Z559_9BACT|nr:PRC-barrel domain-containing protein [Dyadobacter psychrotolerans]TDE18128.1 PRC-barrel domain containing protein [Dyadobacter psychrotolerans]
MKKSLKSLTSISLAGTDGQIGKVKDLYIDDESWFIRYWIVDTGDWLPGKKVLISVQSLTIQDWENDVLETDLTLDQIKNSPDIDTEQPVSRQQEKKLYDHFPWRIYWGPDMGSKGELAPLTESVKAALANDPDYHNSYDNPHLRSTYKLIGYDIQTTDGQSGKIVDLIVETENWEIINLVIEMGNWFSSDKVLLPVRAVTEIKWAGSEIAVSLSQLQIKESLPYEP